MPTQIFYSMTPVTMSIVSYDLTAGEEPFLSFTWDRREGPALQRSGKSAPEMRVINTAQQWTSNPVALRFGTWLVRASDKERKRDQDEISRALAKVPQNSPDATVLRNMAREAIRSHEALFEERLAGYDVVGMQGCGDLTMNEWNVAYVNGKLTEDLSPTVVALRAEPFDQRRYSCLVKWKRIGDGVSRISIEEVRFSRESEVARGKTNNLVRIRAGDRWLPRGDFIEFAVSNQQIIRDGNVVSAIESCHQFGDLRHLLQLPNLNPDAALLAEEEKPFQRRRLFGEIQTSDIWLGEEFLIEKGNNMVRAALSGPITITVPLDCSRELLRAALAAARYEEVLNPTAPLGTGQWRGTDLVKDERRAIEIYFRRNRYAWGMLGLSKDNNTLLSLASDAVPGRSGYVLEDAAQVLREAGAWNALLIDEGVDVFQLYVEQGKDLAGELTLKRTRLRAVFIIGKPPAKAAEAQA